MQIRTTPALDQDNNEAWKAKQARIKFLNDLHNQPAQLFDNAWEATYKAFSEFDLACPRPLPTTRLALHDWQQKLEQIKQSENDSVLKYELLAGFVNDLFNKVLAAQQDAPFVKFLLAQLNELHIEPNGHLPNAVKSELNCLLKFKNFVKENQADELYNLSLEDLPAAEAKQYKTLRRHFVELANTDSFQHTAARYMAHLVQEDVDKKIKNKSPIDYALYNRLLRDSAIVLDTTTAAAEKTDALKRVEALKGDLPGASSVSNKVVGGIAGACVLFLTAVCVTALLITFPYSIFITAPLSMKIVAGLELGLGAGLGVGGLAASTRFFQRCFEKGVAGAASRFTAASQKETAVDESESRLRFISH